MSRTTTGAFDTALAGDHVPLLVFIALDLELGMLRVTNCGQNLAWNGFTWLGMGRLGRVEAIRENSSIENDTLRLQLSGVPNDLIARVQAENLQKRDVTIWLAPLDDEYRVLADPVIVWAGRMDAPYIETEKTSTVVIFAQSRLGDLERARTRRYNDADQKAEYPDDRGFEYAEQMVEKTLPWGR